MKRQISCLLLLLFALCQAACANDFSLEPIKTILQLPEERIDLAQAKLTIDKMIDPGINIKANLEKIDSMVADIQAMLPQTATDMEKLQAIQTYIYKAGKWNGYQPFSYDLDDPLGHNINNKLLPTYLATRKGNCVSMPILFVILGQRLKLDVSLALAPTHIFVKYRNASGTYINLETTSGANPARDIWIRKQLPMTDEAIANGVYMRALGKKESVAAMAMTLAEYYNRPHEHEKEMWVSDLVLKYSPMSVDAMLHNGHACSEIVKEEFVNKYPGPNSIPPEKRFYYRQLARDNQMWFAKAESLGWREPGREYSEQYAKAISNAEQHSIH